MRKIPVVLLAVVLLAGCMTMTRNDSSSIWFDNKSGETITCYVDGEMVFMVEAGKRDIRSVPPGQHKWEARSATYYWHGTVDLHWGQITGMTIEKPGS
jgi:hypothetical protein